MQSHDVPAHISRTYHGRRFDKRRLCHLGGLPTVEIGDTALEAVALVGQFSTRLHHVGHDQLVGKVGFIGATKLEFEFAVTGREYELAAAEEPPAGE